MARVKGEQQRLAGHDGVWLTHAQAAIAIRRVTAAGDELPLSAARLEEGDIVRTIDLLDAPADYLEVFLIDATGDRYYLTATVKP